MLKHLVNLADFLDQKNLDHYATLVDTFIVKAAPDDNTWNEGADFPTYDGPMKTVDVEFSEEPEGGLPKIQLSEMINLDLEKHPLGRAILDYIEKSYQMADDGLTDYKEYHNKDLVSLVDLMSKYDEKLNYDANQQVPLEPIQMRNVLNQALAIGYSLYEPQGHLDMKDVISAVQYLYKYYEDYYLENILHQELTHEPQYDINPKNVALPELTPQERDELWAEQDRYIGTQSTNSWIEETEKSENPIGYERRRQERRKEDQRLYPEEWHDVLFPK